MFKELLLFVLAMLLWIGLMFSFGLVISAVQSWNEWKGRQ